MEAPTDAISEVEWNLLRAHEAIARARNLSRQLSMLELRASGRAMDDPAILPASLLEAQTLVPTHLEGLEPAGAEEASSVATAPAGEPRPSVPQEALAEASSSGSSTDIDDSEEDMGVVSDLSAPAMFVAQKLVLLQQRQNHTLRQLMLLRLQQMQ